MADNGEGAGEPNQEQRTIDARHIRELFVGRLTEEEARTLLRHYNWDRRETVARILAFGPGELNQLLTQLRPHDAQNGVEPAEARIGIVTRDNVLAELAGRNEVGKSCRQFTCDDCYNMWWRNVPKRKLVSRCHRCRKKYEALSRDEEWGWGEFECMQCGNNFHGWARMGHTTSMCFRCRQMCFPVKILPPRKRSDVDDEVHGNVGRRRTRPIDNHSCSARNCLNRRVTGQPADPNQECMHPDRLPRPVQTPSQNHRSKGSTVNTFLPQDDIGPNPYERSMRLIHISESDDSDE